MQLAGLIRGWFQLVYAACKWLQLTGRSSFAPQLLDIVAHLQLHTLDMRAKCANWEVEIGKWKLRCGNLTVLDVIRLTFYV